MGMFRSFFLLAVLSSFNLACSGGGGGGGGNAEPRLTHLTGKDAGQVLANVGGSMASTAPNLSGSAAILSAPHTQATVSIPGFASDGNGGWIGSATNGATPRLRFYNNSDQFVPTSADSDSFATVTKIQVLLYVEKTFSGGYTLTAQAESALASFTPGTPPTFPTTLSFTMTPGTEGKLSGDFGSLNISELSFTADSSGRIIGTGSYKIYGTVQTDIGEKSFNADVSFNNGGCQGATLREGTTVGSGAAFGTAAFDVSKGALIFTINGEEHVVSRNITSTDGSTCSLDNINFTKYAAMSLGQALSTIGQNIGCSHKIESIDGSGNYTVRWYLKGAYERVYIEGTFDVVNHLTGQGIVGINSETNTPYCSHAPHWSGCYQ